MTAPDPGSLFDRQAALDDLYALGRKLNAIAAGHDCAAIEETLARMKQLHTAITATDQRA